ncbi:MAG: hypothetical protein R3F59_20365 [Myxococcota bacterium]
MSFPLTVGGREIPDPPSLATLVRMDAGAASGQVVPGKRPAEWVADLVADGALEQRLAVGLAAALIQHPAAETVCEGARLAVALGEPVLGRVILRALDAHDTGLLLGTDPADPAASVEDVLLRGGVALAELSDDAVRGALLERLRHAGLPGLEVAVLARWSTPEELRQWLPAVLAEALTEAGVAALADRLAVGDEGAEVVEHALADAPDAAARIRARGTSPT